MLAKVKRTMDPENPVVIEKRRQREAVVAARVEREAQREIARQEQERDLAKQTALAAAVFLSRFHGRLRQLARNSSHRASSSSALMSSHRRTPAANTAAITTM